MSRVGSKELPGCLGGICLLSLSSHQIRLLFRCSNLRGSLTLSHGRNPYQFLRQTVCTRWKENLPWIMQCLCLQSIALATSGIMFKNTKLATSDQSPSKHEAHKGGVVPIRGVYRHTRRSTSSIQQPSGSLRRLCSSKTCPVSTTGKSPLTRDIFTLLQSTVHLFKNWTRSILHSLV